MNSSYVLGSRSDTFRQRTAIRGTLDISTPKFGNDRGAAYRVARIDVVEFESGDPDPIYFLSPAGLIEDEDWIEFCKQFTALEGATRVRAIIDSRDGSLAATLESIEAGMRMAVQAGIKTVTWAYLSSDGVYDAQARLIQSMYGKHGIKAQSKTFETFDEARLWTKELVASGAY